MVSSQQVMVADDDEDIRFVLQVALTDAGYLVSAFSDGAAVLDQLRRDPCGWVLLLDWMMPRLDGYETLQAIAADPVWRTDNTFILMTAGGRTLPLAFVRLLDELHVTYLAKPFDLDTLLTTVAAAANRLPSQS